MTTPHPRPFPVVLAAALGTTVGVLYLHPGPPVRARWHDREARELARPIGGGDEQGQERRDSDG